MLRSVRGSGRVACLSRDSLQSRVSLVASNAFARFMWIRIRVSSPLLRNIYIIVCYFPLASSLLVIHIDLVGDLYLDLYADVS